MARELVDVVKDMQVALTDVKVKREALTKAEAVMQEAAKAHRQSQEKAAELRNELEGLFSGLVPLDSQGRVRTSN